MNEQEIEKLLKEMEEREKKENDNKQNKSIKMNYKAEEEKKPKNEYIEKDNPQDREKYEYETFEKDKQRLAGIKKQMSELFCLGDDKEAKKIREHYYEESHQIYEKLLNNYQKIAKPYQDKLEEINENIKLLWAKKELAMQEKEIEGLKSFIVETERLTEEEKNITKKLNEKTVKQRERLDQWKPYLRRKKHANEDETILSNTKEETKEVKKKTGNFSIISLLLGLILGSTSSLVFKNWYIIIPIVFLVGGPYILGYILTHNNEKKDILIKTQSFSLGAVIGVFLGIFILQQSRILNFF